MQTEGWVEGERQNGKFILATNEKNCSSHTPAERIRRERRLDFLQKVLASTEGRVLEVGAGTGTFKGLARRYPGMVAIDISADLLALASQRAPDVELHCMNPQIFLQKTVPAIKRAAGDSPDECAFTATRIVLDLESCGYADIRVEAYEFRHPATPALLIPGVIALERLLERSPVRRIDGSLRIQARKP